jgi:hypothetical protein
MIYELTYATPNGDWHYWRMEAKDFQAACENALQNAKVRPHLRLIRIENLTPIVAMEVNP